MPQLIDIVAAATRLSPAQLASALLTEANGIARNAETRVWEVHAKVTDQGKSYLKQVVVCLLDGTEEPRVPRVTPLSAWDQPQEAAPTLSAAD